MGHLTKAISDWTTSLTRVPEARVKAVGPNVPNIGSIMSLDINPSGLDAPYSNSAWVYACISRIADAVGSLPVRFGKGTDEDYETVEDPELSNILRFPSEQCVTQAQLWQLTEIYLDAKGLAFWVKVGVTDPWSMPEAIIVVSPERMKPITSKDHGLAGWKYQNGTVSKNLETWEVVRFFHPDPSDPYGGLSPLEAASAGIVIDKSAEAYSESFFKNAGVVSGVLTSTGPMDKPVLRQFKRQFQTEYGGAQNAYKVLALESGMTFNNISTSQKDMDFLNQRAWSRDEIIAVLRCNKHILGLTDSYNKATAMEAEKSFYVHGVMPRAKMFAEALWGQWLRWRKEQVWLYFDFSRIESLQKDKSALSLDIGRYQQAGVSLTEINRLLDLGLNLDDNPYADVHWVRKGLVPIEFAMDPAMQTSGGGAETAAITAPPMAKAITKAPDPEELVNLPSTLFNEALAAESLRKAIEPYMKEAVELALKQIAKEGVAITFDWTTSKLYADFFKTKWNKVKTIPVHHHKWMKRSIEKAIEKGDTVGEIAKMLDERFEIQGKGNALTIARTETGDTIDNSRYNAMVEEDVPYHAWMSAHDGAVRKSHREGNWSKTWVEVGNPFPNGLINPHDPNPDISASEKVNCFLPGTTVSGAFIAGSKAFYSGPARELITARGHRLCLTPNHPVLTPDGPFPAYLLGKGDTLFADRREAHGDLMVDNVNHQHGPALIENVFDAISANGTRIRSNPRDADFHGDAARFNGDIEIVGIHGVLADGWKSSGGQGITNVEFEPTNPVLVGEHGLGRLDQLLGGPLSASTGIPRGRALTANGSGVLLESRPLHALRIGPASAWDIALSKNPVDYASSKAVVVRELLRACSGNVLADKIISIRDFHFSGHVYDLQSKTGWIIAQNIVSSNCRCTTFPLMDKPEGKVATAGEWDARVKATTTSIEKKVYKAVLPWLKKLTDQAKASLRKAN